jgi:ABC-2 type transport system ATP-binding protein
MPETTSEPREDVEPRENVVQVDGLTVRYGGEKVLQGVSFGIDPGSVWALLGRNGAGKSSLVRCLLGHQKPQAGRVRIFGRDSWKDRVPLMRRTGVVPEVDDAPPGMSARQLSRFCSSLYPRWDAASIFERLARFEVPDKVPFGKLSKGQKGQVQLALALAHSPELLVLDDPTLGLDVVARKAVFEELVVELADRGTTVFLTSHDLPGVEAIASHVAFLKEGRLILDEDINDVKARFRRLTFGPVGGPPHAPIGVTELDANLAAPMGLLSCERRGRDLEVLVERYSDEAFEVLRETPGLDRVEAWPVSLEEVLIAVAGTGRPAGGDGG